MRRILFLQQRLALSRSQLHIPSGVSCRRCSTKSIDSNGNGNVNASVNVNDNENTKDQFLFGMNEERKLFNDLGLSESLIYALKANKKSIPTIIQSKSFKPIYAGRDVVIGAETGSGKTFAFLLPIIQKMMNGLTPRLSPNYPSTYILVPSKELCQQVNTMAQSLLTPLKHISTENLPSCAPITSVNMNWPFKGKNQNSPDIVICTPAFLASFLRGPHILEKGVFDSLRTLVLDEADLLLDGSYKKDIEKIMAALKVTRRKLISEGKVKVHEPYVQFILSAATIPTHGALSVAKNIRSTFPQALEIRNHHLHKHHPRIRQTFVELPEEEDVQQEQTTQGIPVIIQPKRLQAIITAIHSKSTNHNELIRSISSEEFQSATAESSNLNQESQQLPYESTMIFANSAENAQLLAEALRERNIPCEEFHNRVQHEIKLNSFQNFVEGKSSILVCTDAASRGLDIPGVKHIIQAEFALNVVQHLHRIGRASRAGALGRATNFIDNRSKELVQLILSDQENDSIDQSFSRKRGFRRHLKRKMAKEAEGNEHEGNDDEDGEEDGEEEEGNGSPK